MNQPNPTHILNVARSLYAGGLRVDTDMFADVAIETGCTEAEARLTLYNRRFGFIADAQHRFAKLHSYIEVKRLQVSCR